MFNYDEAYRQPDLYWGEEPNPLCRQVLDLIPVASRPDMRVIDLGCGEGRDLIHFARHGLEAVGVDLSEPGLAKAGEWARREGLTVQTVRANLVGYRLGEPFDIIYSSGTLTYLPPGARADAFRNYREHTRPGGLNAFNVFVEKPFLATPPDWGENEYFYRSGELLGYYWDWEILHFEEVIFDCNSSGVPHRHAMDVMIARKPLSALA